tara:strand:+ start:519 stop:812 length:294 start_codon:yes stop_codon:yes gene_type:complete
MSKTYNDIENDECCICLRRLVGELVKINCGHIYHYQCVKDWIKQKKNLNRTCCICENPTEIVNIFNNLTQPLEVEEPKEHKPFKEEEIKISWCCQIL